MCSMIPKKIDLIVKCVAFFLFVFVHIATDSLSVGLVLSWVRMWTQVLAVGRMLSQSVCPPTCENDSGSLLFFFNLTSCYEMKQKIWIFFHSSLDLIRINLQTGSYTLILLLILYHSLLWPLNYSVIELQFLILLARTPHHRLLGQKQHSQCSFKWFITFFIC